MVGSVADVDETASDMTATDTGRGFEIGGGTFLGVSVFVDGEEIVEEEVTFGWTFVDATLDFASVVCFVTEAVHLFSVSIKACFPAATASERLTKAEAIID